MNQMKKTKAKKPLFFLTMLLFALLAMIGCEQNSVGNIAGPEDTFSADAPGNSFHKPGNGKGQTNGSRGGQINWPITASKTFRFHPGQNAYKGGNILFGNNNKSKFKLVNRSLTPPPEIPRGADVTITMEIDYDSLHQELFFTFTPHGCQFNPRAMVKFDYSALGVQLPVLYYINENGNRIRQDPEQINVSQKWIMIRLDHFSRYAVARS